MLKKGKYRCIWVIISVAAFIFSVSVFCYAADISGEIDALKDSDPIKRAAAAKALGKAGDAGAVEPLIEALKAENESEEENDRVEKYIIIALGELKDARAVDILLAVISESEEGEEELDEDEEDYVQEAAINALGAIGDKRAVDEIKEIMEETKSAKVNRAAKKALEKLK